MGHELIMQHGSKAARLIWNRTIGARWRVTTIPAGTTPVHIEGERGRGNGRWRKVLNGSAGQGDWAREGVSVQDEDC